MEDGLTVKVNFGRYLKPSEAPCSFCGVDVPGKSGFLLKVTCGSVQTINEIHLCSKCLEHSRQYEAEIDLTGSNSQHAVRLGF